MEAIESNADIVALVNALQDKSRASRVAEKAKSKRKKSSNSGSSSSSRREKSSRAEETPAATATSADMKEVHWFLFLFF